MAVRTRLLTFNDLERMRETRTDRLELIEGELYVTPSPMPMHQFVSGRLFFWFKQTVLRLGYGLVFDAPLDVHLAEKTIVQPDLIFILPDRRPTVTAGKMEGAPSLAVEILSPSTRAYDRTTKRDVYAQYGVPEYWLVDIDERIVTVYTEPKDGRYRVERVASETAMSETVPGLSADLVELFSPIPDE